MTFSLLLISSTSEFSSWVRLNFETTVDYQSLVHAFGRPFKTHKKQNNIKTITEQNNIKENWKQKRQERGQGGSSPRGDTGGLPTVWRHPLVCTEPLTDPTTTLLVDLPLRVDWERIETPKIISPKAKEFLSDRSK